MLGYGLCRHLVDHGHQVTGIARKHEVGVPGVTETRIDLLDTAALRAAVDDLSPDVIVHCAGLTSVDGCERDEPLARALHVEAAALLAECATGSGARMIQISTDHLWDGSRPMITEDTPPAPINAYARTKAAGEAAVLAMAADSLIVRTNFCGPGRPWRKSLADWVFDELSAGRPIAAFTDVFFTPITVPRLAQAIVDLFDAGGEGVFNVAGSERVSKYDFARRYARDQGLDETLVSEGSIKTIDLAAARPFDMSLSTEKVSAFLDRRMPDLNECFADLTPFAKAL